MTDYAPFYGRRRTADCRIALARTLWIMQSAVGKRITAAIFDVVTGRELRVSLGEDLLESRLSRTDDAPLETRAQEIRTVLATRGWADVSQGN